MDIIATDGDTADPRPILITIEGDTQGYFDISPDKDSGKAILITTDIPIDRESDAVMQNGGVYSFYLKVYKCHRH